MCQNITSINPECIQPFAKAPWTPPVEVYLPDRENAIKEASIVFSTIVFTNASSRNNLIGVGICWFGILPTIPSDRSSESVNLTIGIIKEFNVYVGELTAI